MMKRVGIQKPTTFDALSEKTKRKLKEARQKSHGSLTPSNQSPSNQSSSNQSPSSRSPNNGSRVLSGYKSDSKLQTVKLMEETKDSEQERGIVAGEVEREVKQKERLKLVAPSSKPSLAAKIMSLQPPTDNESNTDTNTDTNTDFNADSTDSTDIQKPLNDTDVSHY